MPGVVVTEHRCRILGSEDGFIVFSVLSRASGTGVFECRYLKHTPHWARTLFSLLSVCVASSDPDYMLALALQQEDESALESTSPNPSNVLGDEAVAMALFGQDERAPVEQRLGGSTADAPLAAAGHGTDQDRFVALLHAFVRHACERQ